MRFKEIRGIGVPYAKQGQIFFTLANYKNLPKGQRDRIDELIRKAAKGDESYIAAVRDWLLFDVAFDTARYRHYVNGATMVKIRKRIYEWW